MKLKNKIFEARDIAHKHKLDERERENEALEAMTNSIPNQCNGKPWYNKATFKLPLEVGWGISKVIS